MFFFLFLSFSFPLVSVVGCAVCDPQCMSARQNMTAWSTRTITGTSCMTSAMRRTALVPAASSGAMTAGASLSTTSVTPTGTVTMEKTSRVVQVRWHNSMGRQDTIGVRPLPGYLSVKGISSSMHESVGCFKLCGVSM